MCFSVLLNNFIVSFGLLIRAFAGVASREVKILVLAEIKNNNVADGECFTLRNGFLRPSRLQRGRKRVAGRDAFGLTMCTRVLR